MSERRFVIFECSEHASVDSLAMSINEPELRRRFQRCFGAYADNRPMDEIIDYFIHGTDKEEPAIREYFDKVSDEELQKDLKEAGYEPAALAGQEDKPMRRKRRKRGANRLGPKGLDRRGAGWNRI